MRIGVLGSRGYPSTYGGYETFVREFAPEAVRRGHEVLVYCRSRPGADASWSIDGVECRFTRGLETRQLSTLSFGLSSALDARHRALDAALVLNCANGYWLPLLRGAGVPTALNVDGLEWQRAKWSRIARLTFLGGARMAARFADLLVADSEAIAETWHRRFGPRPRYIPYGARIPDDQGAEQLQQLGLTPGSYVLTVARLVSENNVELTLDALAGMDRPPVHVVVGSSPWPTELQDRLSELSSRRADFHWLGHVSDQSLLAELYQHCAVYVHGHSVGGTNPALLEARGAGAPVIAHDNPFNREVLREGGLYYDSAGSLREALERLLDSPELRGELAVSGRERLAEQYSWQGTCDRYLELLTELSAGGRGARSR